MYIFFYITSEGFVAC